MAKVPRAPNGKPQSAKWKTPDQIATLKRESKCYRCERRGCNTKILKYYRLLILTVRAEEQTLLTCLK